MRVAVIDVGSPKSAGLGWWISGPEPQGGGDVDRCIEAVADALARGPVALGFEAPMFVPLRSKPSDLTMARKGEGNRAFSGGAGGGVTTIGVLITAYALAELRKRVPDAVPTLDWRKPRWRAGDLLLFEAFVTGRKRAKTAPNRHVDDARDAATEFLRHGAPSAVPNAIEDPTTAWLNLLGAALLRTGWTTDLAVLDAACLVVRA